MVPTIPGINDLLGHLVDSATSSVFDGLVTWMARGLAMLIEWIWGTLDAATTPHITEPWFARDLLGPIILLAVAVTVAMMLASGIQAALAGRPEQILDAFKHGAWSIVATALTVTVMDVMVQLVDGVSAGIWDHARDDLQHLLESVIVVMQNAVLTEMGFLAVVLLLFMYLALIGLAMALAMRSALIYVTAALAPLVFASSVLPMFRDSARKIVHLAVSLVVSKLAIVITLTLAVKVMANATNIAPTGDQLKDGVAALGVLFAGVVCFAVASITPLVLYKLMPTVEGAMIGAGVAGGWGRGAMTGMYGASTMKNLGGSLGRLGSKPVPEATGGSTAGAESAAVGAGEATAAGGASAASGASNGAAAAGAGAVAVPVMVATAGVDAFRSGISTLTDHAAATTEAAQSPQSNPSTTPPTTPSTTTVETGSGESGEEE
jgi:hypothetical protein